MTNISTIAFQNTHTTYSLPVPDTKQNKILAVLVTAVTLKQFLLCSKAATGQYRHRDEGGVEGCEGGRSDTGREEGLEERVWEKFYLHKYL